MGQTPGSGVPADIGNGLDVVRSKQIEVARKLPRGMTDAPKLHRDAHPPAASNRRLQQVTPLSVDRHALTMGERACGEGLADRSGNGDQHRASATGRVSSTSG